MVLDLDTVKNHINEWLINFVEQPHPALGGWPPCPYARRARLDHKFEVRIGTTPLSDIRTVSHTGLAGMDVVIYAYDPADVNWLLFQQLLDIGNQEFLVGRNLIALGDHPDDEEIVNGVCMNQGHFALSLVQSLSDLNAKAKLMADKGFYSSWPESYLKSLFQHRKDPRL